MKRFLSSLGLVLLSLGATAPSAEAEQLGYGRLLVNDFFGDGHDRWRTGSIVGSHVFGPSWSGALPESFGEVIELRILGQIIAPENLAMPSPVDRSYAGAISVGAHTHFQQRGLEFALGADVTFTGPQTGLGDFQSWLHGQFDFVGPSSTVLNSQIGNAVHLDAVAEVGHSYQLGQMATARPFLEARAGTETLVRAGVDVTFGTMTNGSLLVRDPVSGQRYRAIEGGETGVSFVVGADIAYVDSSVFIPGNSAAVMEDSRHRLRAGLLWQGESHSIYYGASYLSPEFTSQDEGQIVGALRVKIDF
ncbi:DUF2219 family protein [Cognatishimia sp. SS12]|uniref:lipid A-modifier LpxR family protein n=1 Tax=Cognatishimia sp. SS12 TaxID=2979465 RepID=UPI00232BCF63|nr:lipid A-modifier LpxR family protein [Cognatishimia sp. SS12]MDC0738872.1 DUF2219 family protein [Cognatishimia sp. SS12]